MNLFNSYQALAFFCATPFGVQWLFQNGYDVWGYVMCLPFLIGFIMIGVCINEQATKI